MTSSPEYRAFCVLAGLTALALASTACTRGEESDGEIRRAPHPHPPGLVVAGSGSNYSLVRAIAGRYRAEYADTKLRLPHSIGTGGAVRALLDGAIDVGLASRPLKPEERALGLVETPHARIAIAFVANAEVGSPRLTRNEIKAVYLGQRTAWPDNTPIVPLIREPGDSSRRVFARELPEIEKVIEEAYETERWRVCYTDGEMLESVKRIPGALGFMDLGTLRRDAPGLPVVWPSQPPAGDEPTLNKPLSFLTFGKPRGEARRFIEFALSGEVRDILEHGGYLPPAPAPEAP